MIYIPPFTWGSWGWENSERRNCWAQSFLPPCKRYVHNWSVVNTHHWISSLCCITSWMLNMISIILFKQVTVESTFYIISSLLLKRDLSWITKRHKNCERWWQNMEALVKLMLNQKQWSKKEDNINFKAQKPWAWKVEHMYQVFIYLVLQCRITVCLAITVFFIALQICHLQSSLKSWNCVAFLWHMRFLDFEQVYSPENCLNMCFKAAMKLIACYKACLYFLVIFKPQTIWASTN